MLKQKDFDEIREVIREETKHLPSKDDFYDKMDEMMGEIKAVREEQKVISGCKDQIEDHETRIGKIEEVLLPQN